MDLDTFLRERGLKKSYFASLIGVHRTTLSQYLSGAMPISLEIQARIDRAVADLSSLPRVGGESSEPHPDSSPSTAAGASRSGGDFSEKDHADE
jgi:DNA-binding transcriptional regulator YdaS (Cro superfamily)